MADGCEVALEMETNDRGGHHGKLRVVLRHLMNRSIRTLNRELHQVFNVGAVHLMTKGFIEHFDSCLGRNFSRLRAADAISDGKDSAFAVGKKGVLVKRTLFI